MRLTEALQISPELFERTLDSLLVMSKRTSNGKNWRSRFRRTVVDFVRARVEGGARLPDAITEVCKISFIKPCGKIERAKPRSIYRWLEKSKKEGESSLDTPLKPMLAPSSVLPQELLDYLADEKNEDRRASIPELLERAVELGHMTSVEDVDRTTVWRALNRMGISTVIPKRSQKPESSEGKKRFEYPHRMMMVLCDGKRFRAGIKRRRRVVLFFLDDATRYLLGAIVGTEENTDLFLRGLWSVLCMYGFMTVIFVDRGPGFISKDTQDVVAQLPGVSLVWGTAGYPQGHGKIEKFNQTSLNKVLRSFDGAPDVDPDCRALELRLQHYISRYNHTPHTSLNQETPYQRWHRDERPLRFPSDEDALRKHFIVTETRTVSKDRIIQFEGTEYETPSVKPGPHPVYRNALTGELSMVHNDRTLVLHPVDKHFNALQKRQGCSTDTNTTTQFPPPKTAAVLAYERDFSPIVQPDGGYSDDEE